MGEIEEGDVRGAGGRREQDEPKTPDNVSLVIGRKVVCQLQKISLLGREVGRGKRRIDFEVRLESKNHDSKEYQGGHSMSLGTRKIKPGLYCLLAGWSWLS